MSNYSRKRHAEVTKILTNKDFEKNVDNIEPNS